MARKTTKELMEEKAKKLSNVSPSQALFGMNSDNNNEEKGTDTETSESVKQEIADTTAAKEKVEEQSEIQEGIEPVSNKDNARDDKKHQLLTLKKQKVEDTHTRSTFLVRNDLLKRFNKLATGKHGFKTEFINYAIESTLNELEEELKNQ